MSNSFGFAIVLGLLLTACPDRETRPGRDDTSAPADGGTGEGAAAQTCEDKLEILEAELVECKTGTPEATK